MASKLPQATHLEPVGPVGRRKGPVNITLDDAVLRRAQELAVARGLIYAGRGNLSALFAQLVTEAPFPVSPDNPTA